MKSWSRVKSGVSELRTEVVSQSRVRIAICAFMGGYYAIFAMPNHPVYLIFVLYSIALLFIAQKVSARLRTVPIATLIIDNSFAIWGLHVTGEVGSFLLFFLVHFSFAYGIRYGRNYLFGSLLISCTGVTWLFFQSFPWQGHIHFLLSFLFGMPFLAMYVYSLTEELRRSEVCAITNAERTAQLLVFLAHDIRTPLHQLLGSINKLQVSGYSAPCIATLNNMENLVNLMARMCSGIVAGQTVKDTSRLQSGRETEESQCETINQRIVTFVELFRERIEREGAVLRYDLSTRIVSSLTADWAVAERILLNVISNAARHCRDGYIEIRSLPEPSNEKKIRIEIENAGASRLNESEPASAPETVEKSIFFGTSIGLHAMQDVVSSAGGAYSFQPIDSATFLSTMVLPVSTNVVPRRSMTLFPVVLLSRDFGFVEKCASMLSDSANLYCYASLESFNAHIQSYVGEIAAIFLDLPGGCDSVEPTVIDEISARHGLVVMLSSRDTDLEKILFESDQLRIARESDRSTWLQVLRLSEEIRTSKQISSAQSSHGTGNLTSIKVLALDDNSLNLSFLVAGLNDYGLSVKPVETLEAALQEILQEDYDVLILDWNIGHVTALDLLKAIQDGSLANSLEVFLLTAQDIDLESLPLRSLKRITILAKPIDNASVFCAIRGRFLLPDYSATKEEGITADRIFFCSSYSHMSWKGESITVMDELLGRFLTEIQERVSEFVERSAFLSHEELIRRLHSMASLCYSIGAYALGDEFKNQQELFLGEVSRHESRLDVHLARARDVLALTKMHVSMFQLSIRARGAS